LGDGAEIAWRKFYLEPGALAQSYFWPGYDFGWLAEDVDFGHRWLLLRLDVRTDCLAALVATRKTGACGENE
jgi:hypothetical protein